MKYVFAIISMVVATLVYADKSAPKMNKYDSIFLDCIDYGHSEVAPDKKYSCHEKAKSEILSTFKAYQDFLDCIDYGHGTVTIDQEKSCLKLIGK